MKQCIIFIVVCGFICGWLALFVPDTPETIAYVSWSTGKCVSVRQAGNIMDCGTLDLNKPYTKVWVQ